MEAEGLATYTLQEHGLDPSQIASQTYDRALVIAQKCSNVFNRLHLRHYMCGYVHCLHELHYLVLVDTTKILPQASKFLL